MSEFQRYEFLAIDRLLDAQDRAKLRRISSRAKITASSFVNTYEWGDLKADPKEMVERWFDLHLYGANWGSRRLIIKLPSRLLDGPAVAAVSNRTDLVTISEAGDNAIVDIQLDDNGADFEYDVEGAVSLATLAPLRADLLVGDDRLFYLVWLLDVQCQRRDEDETEPLPGLGPLTPALSSFAELFDIDPDLVQAASERSNDTASPSSDAVRSALSRMSTTVKDDMLARMIARDPYVAAELQRHVRSIPPRPGAPSPPPRTAAALLARAQDVRLARETAEAERRREKQRRDVAAAERQRLIRVKQVEAEGEAAWERLESEIQRRHAAAYDTAATLLGDLRDVAIERDAHPLFRSRLADIRRRHSTKRTLMDRLSILD